MRFHMLQNVQTSLDYLRYRKVSLFNGRSTVVILANWTIATIDREQVKKAKNLKRLNISMAIFTNLI